jgi:hypothetical protein
MRQRRYVVGEHEGDYAIILDEIDSETGRKINPSSVILVGFKSAEAAQQYIKTIRPQEPGK